MCTRATVSCDEESKRINELRLYREPLEHEQYGKLSGELVTVEVTYDRVSRYYELFNIMTRGAGWLRCSGILSDAGPLVKTGMFRR